MTAMSEAGRKSHAALFMRRLLRAPLSAAGLFVLIVVILAAILAPYLAPYDPADAEVLERLHPPLWVSETGNMHWLGTDSLGRDVLSRVIFGARVSLLVGLSVVLFSGTVGVVLGLISGYLAGTLVDDLIMRIADVQLAFPFLLIAIAFLAVLGPGLVNVVLVLTLFGWVQYARVVRGQAMALREMEFVDAAKAIGVRDIGIVIRHILPNTWAPTIVMASFSVASTILSEAALSFLGLGVKPSMPTWGNMLAEGRDYITMSWWIVTFPGLALLLTVLGINLFGDWLRDYLDPRLRN